MSQALNTPSTSSLSNFQSIFNAAVDRYETKTKSKLLIHPLAAQLQSCDSPTAVLSLLQGLVQQFDQGRSSDERIRSWLNPTVNVLFAFSATLGEGVGLVFSPAKVIFAGIGILFQAAKDVDASQDMLIDLFWRIESFFRRLESYTEVRPTAAMMDIIVKIMVEILTVLAIATKDIKQRRAKKYVKKLLGKNEIEDSLKRLDTLTHEEARMATAEILRVTHSVDDNVRVVLDDGKGTKDIVQQTAQDVDEVRLTMSRQDLRKWLSPPNPSTNHNTAHSSQHEGTATWFFQGSIYEEWRSTPSLLWIHGKPGSGKSVLCSAIIEDIIALREAESASMAYFYCDFRDEDKQSHRNILLSILFQLSAQSDLYFDLLSQFYSKHDKGAQTPNDGTLMKCLKDVLSFPNQDPVFLIVDALDECPDNTGMPSSREQVLDLVQHLVGLCQNNLHICVTSRPEIDIRTALEPLTSLCVSLHEQTGQKKDIVEYVSSVVHSDTKMRRWREEDKKLVIETLSERADGMFRWVYCQLEALRHCLPPSVKGILDELPESLDGTYERVLRNINKANRDHAFRLLQCVTVAVRPLHVEELAEVLAVDFDAARNGGMPNVKPDWRWSDQHQAVLSTCSSLIAIVDNGHYQVVQFSHFSVKEFLTSDRLTCSSGDVSRYHILLSPAHLILAQACLGVLLRLDEHVTEDSASDIPLARYAAQHWVDHAQFEDVSSHIQDVMVYFFDADKPHWAAWHSVYDIDDQHWWRFTPNSVTCRPPPLYYTALCGFYDLAEHLVVKNPEHINAMGGRMVTPLIAALHRRHFRVADLLHAYSSDIHARGKWGGTVLHGASWNGLVDVVQWLLGHGVDVNARDVDDFTPLHLRWTLRHPEICRMLLEHNADIDIRDKYGKVPLHWVAMAGDLKDVLKTMQLLLDYGADPNVRDDDGCTPLHDSSWWKKETYNINGTVGGSRLLLDRGANIDAENNEGKTPLQLALEKGRREMVEFLLGRRASHK